MVKPLFGSLQMALSQVNISTQGFSLENNHFANFNSASNMESILAIVSNMLIGIPIYLGIAYKMNILNDVFGKEYLNRIIKKLTFGKVSLS